MKSPQRLFLLVILALGMTSGRIFADDVTLEWNPSTDASVASYNLYYWDADQTFTNVLPVGPATKVTVSNLTSQIVYYFAATAVDANGLESNFSYPPAVYPMPPFITLQPTNQILCNSSDAQFFVGVGGTAPLSFQWMFNGAPIDGESKSNLIIPNATLAQAGTYSLVVTNFSGAITSALAQLVFPQMPSVTQRPLSQTVVAGSEVLFTVTAVSSTPLSYQWFFNGNNIEGAVSNTLSLQHVQPSQNGTDVVSVAVFNPCKSDSSAALLVVLDPPVISSQSASQTVIAGTDASFQVTATGAAPLSYQWIFNGTPLAGATFNTLILTNVQPALVGSYYAVVTNIDGATSSKPAVLTVITPPSILTQPSNQVVIPGAEASFHIVATGTPPLSYQWLFDGGIITGATTDTLTLVGAQSDQAGEYAVVITNSAGSTNSLASSLKVLVPPTIAGIGITDTTFSCSLTTVEGLTYVLESQDYFSSFLWTQVALPLAGTGGVLTMQDTNAIGANRFYRVRAY